MDRKYSVFVLVREKEGSGTITIDGQTVYSWLMASAGDGYYYRIYEGDTFSSKNVRKITPKYPDDSYTHILSFVRLWLRQHVEFHDKV